MTLSRALVKQFLIDYLNKLSPTSDDIFTTIFSYTKSKLSFTTPPENIEDCYCLWKRIDEITSANEVVELILSIGETAHDIQNGTIKTSRCSETFHAIRNYLLRFPKINLKKAKDSIEIPGVQEAIQKKIKEIEQLLIKQRSADATFAKDNPQLPIKEVDNSQYYRQLIYLGYDYEIMNLGVTEKQMKKNIFPESGVFIAKYDWSCYPDDKLNKLRYSVHVPRIAQEFFAEMLAYQTTRCCKTNILDSYQELAINNPPQFPENLLKELKLTEEKNIPSETSKNASTASSTTTVLGSFSSSRTSSSAMAPHVVTTFHSETASSAAKNTSSASALSITISNTSATSPQPTNNPEPTGEDTLTGNLFAPSNVSH